MAGARVGQTIKFEDLPGTMAEGVVWSEAWVIPTGSRQTVLVVLRTRGSSRKFYREQ